MNLDNLNKWLSLLANVGVLIGIFILIAELNQNTNIQRVASSQQILELSAIGNLQLYSNRYAALIEAGFDANELPSFEEDDETFNRRALAIFASHWQVFYQHQEGFMDEGIFEAYERRTVNVLSQPRMMDWWHNSKMGFSDSYIEYVDGIIENM